MHIMVTLIGFKFKEKSYFIHEAAEGLTQLPSCNGKVAADPVSTKETWEICNDLRHGGLHSYFASTCLFLWCIQQNDKTKMPYTRVRIGGPTKCLTLQVVWEM